MKKRIISVLIISVIFILTVLFTMISTSAYAIVDYQDKNITDEQLVKMVASGEIPQDITLLVLSNNQISDLTPLSDIIVLDYLVISNNQINNINPLSSLTMLRGLFLSENKITDISPLSSLEVLDILTLDDNQINDLSPLYELTNLGVLALNNNPINEFHIIELKSHLPNCIIEYTPTPGHVLGNIDVTIFDGIEILKYLVGIESVIDDSKVALEAAMMTAESKARGEPTIFDFVEILLILVDM